MKTTTFAAAALALFCFPPFAWSQVIELFPDGAPGEENQEIGPETWKPSQKPGADPDITRLTNVTKPRLEIFPAPGDGAKPAVLICPGGGYSILAMKHEGTMAADWLNAQGYTALVLTYRVPRREGREPHEAPLEDARKALELARQNAEAWKLDPDRIGILGFSAGGNLAAHAAYGAQTHNLPPNQRPDFAVLVYPAYLLNEAKDALQSAFKVTPESPPCFLVHAHDDRGGAHVEGSVRLYLELSAKNVAAELHVYSRGAHGFGMLDRGAPISSWPKRCQDWLALHPKSG